MAKFIILMRENDNAWGRLSAEEQQSLLKKYFAWVDELKSAERLVGGEPLGSGGRVLRVDGDDIVDGPFTETKEVITGFFIIEAKDLDEATEVGRGCPALGHGETVVVRPIGHL